MTVEEANKINDLYKQLDQITAENATLKTALASKGDDNNTGLRLGSIEKKLDDLLAKTKDKSK